MPNWMVCVSVSFLGLTRVKRIPETCMSSCVGGAFFFALRGTVVKPLFVVAISCAMGLVGVVLWTCWTLLCLLRLALQPALTDRLPEAALAVVVLGAIGGFWDGMGFSLARYQGGPF